MKRLPCVEVLLVFTTIIVHNTLSSNLHQFHTRYLPNRRPRNVRLTSGRKQCRSRPWHSRCYAVLWAMGPWHLERLRERYPDIQTSWPMSTYVIYHHITSLSWGSQEANGFWVPLLFMILLPIFRKHLFMKWILTACHAHPHLRPGDECQIDAGSHPNTSVFAGAWRLKCCR